MLHIYNSHQWHKAVYRIHKTEAEKRHVLSVGACVVHYNSPFHSCVPGGEEDKHSLVN